MLNNLMQLQFVKIIVDVYCKWSEQPPVYRAYVNNELFTERTWIWKNQYLEEEFQIRAAPGVYDIRYELVNSPGAGLKTRNMRVVDGSAVNTRDGKLEIRYATE